MKPATYGVEAARSQLADLLERANGGTTTIITRHGKAFAALAPLDAVKASRSTPSILTLKGSGKGLWGKCPSQGVAAMRDEWE